MTLYRRTYQPYRGERLDVHRLFWVIARRELRLALSKKWVRRLFVLGAIPLIAASVFLYVQIVVERALNLGLFGGVAFREMYAPQMLFMVLMMAAAGADLVAKDVRTQAHHLYFARPLTRGQYVLGKLLAIGSVLLALMWLPGVLLALVALVLAPEPDYLDFAAKVAQVTAYSVLAAVAGAAIITTLSAYGRRSRYVGLLWVGLFFLSDVVSEILERALERDWPHLISLAHLFQDSGLFLYASKDRPDAWALVVLALLAVFSVAVLYRRIRVLERRES